MYSRAVNEKSIRSSVLTSVWTRASLTHFISAPLAICAPLKGSSLCLSLLEQSERGWSGAGDGGSLHFLNPVSGPLHPWCTSSPPHPPHLLSSSLVVSAPSCRHQSVAPFKMQTLCCAMSADVSSCTDWQPGLLTYSTKVAGGLAGAQVHEMWWYIEMHASVQANVCILLSGVPEQ